MSCKRSTEVNITSFDIYWIVCAAISGGSINSRPKNTSMLKRRAEHVTEFHGWIGQRIRCLSVDLLATLICARPSIRKRKANRKRSYHFIKSGYCYYCADAGYNTCVRVCVFCATVNIKPNGTIRSSLLRCRVI